ncbi:PQQ-dependent sugar dehydrogenase [Maritalea mobilis]|nr:PQQ-dependent sugar dehydrogenase [Maritalea mobilis]
MALPALAQTPVVEGGENLPSAEPAFAEQTDAPEQISDLTLARQDVATGLEHPWAVAVLPNGAGYLVTERPGRLRHITRDGEISDPISGVPEVDARSQGGLLDVAIAPDFEDSRVIYLTYARPMGDGMTATAAARARLSEDMTALSGVEDIFVQSPPSPSPMHFGSRVVPTGDGHLFITTGEHFTRAERDLAQAVSTTYGKVVRVTPEGDVPGDNPFVEADAALGEIWTLGHRNVQGAALHPETGALWTIEHGPAGGDELNLIEAGANYGWPIVTYGVNYDGTPIGAEQTAHAPAFVEPRYYWDPVIAPGGMVFYEGEMFPEWQGDILASGLVAASIVRLDLNGDTVAGEEWLMRGIGRVRDVAVDEDGAIVTVLDLPDAPLVRLVRED